MCVTHASTLQPSLLYLAIFLSMLHRWSWNQYLLCSSGTQSFGSQALFDYIGWSSYIVLSIMLNTCGKVQGLHWLERGWMKKWDKLLYVILARVRNTNQFSIMCLVYPVATVSNPLPLSSTAITCYYKFKRWNVAFRLHFHWKALT